jgi:hypothetical protein
VTEPLRDLLRRDELEIETLHTTEDRDRNLVYFRRGENELHVRRRLFERLQKRVPRVRREHVHFVDDEDLVAIACRPVRQRVLELPDLVDAVVAGAVDLSDVHVGASRDLEASRTLEAGRHARPRIGARWRRRRIAHAVQGLREDARARGFSDAAHTREQERVRDTTRLDGVAEDACNVVLANQILEAHRPPFPCEHDIAHRRHGVADRAARGEGPW